MAVKLIPNISHISSHMNCTHLSEDVSILTKKLAKEYHIPVEPDLEYKNVAGYDGPHKTSAEKVQSFIKMLNKLEAGKTYIFIDHPGFDNEELRAIHHIGYEGVAEDRQGVTDLFTSEKVKAVIKQNGIQLSGYKDLLK